MQKIKKCEHYKHKHMHSRKVEQSQPSGEAKGHEWSKMRGGRRGGRGGRGGGLAGWGGGGGGRWERESGREATDLGNETRIANRNRFRGQVPTKQVQGTGAQSQIQK